MLINEAWAQTGASAGGDLWSMVPIILMFVVLYFIMIRPQMKRAKELRAMVDALQKGDEVVAAGGIVGRIIKLSDNYLTLQIADGVDIQVQRASVQVVLPKGAIKNIE